jgi:hypothetical protein
MGRLGAGVNEKIEQVIWEKSAGLVFEESRSVAG